MIKFVFQNWAFRPENFEQCLDEKNTTKDESTFKEGCRIYGYLEVNRVSGSFHIAPGKSFAVNHVHGICFLKSLSYGLNCEHKLVFICSTRRPAPFIWRFQHHSSHPTSFFWRYFKRKRKSFGWILYLRW